MTKFTHVVKIDFHYKIYTTCGENSFIYTTCGENCHSNVLVTFSVISKIGPTFLMSQLQLKIFQYVVKIILPCHLVLKILYDTKAASSVLFRWFKFTLKRPNSMAHGNFFLAIWDTSHWNFSVKFGLKTPYDISKDPSWSILTYVNFWRLQGHSSNLPKKDAFRKSIFS